MKEKRTYLGGLMHGIGTLLTGMKVTGREFFTKKVTEQYPENRNTLEISPRFRGRLVMPIDEEGNHKCIACGLCQMACPNDTIRIISESITDEETGKKKKVLVKYEYDLGACMFCQLCVNACNHHAIEFSTEFENAVFNRDTLVLTLNKK
ncbi:MAG: NADH-quinone oxidoreductase subunit I [Bacteroidaceae bacterium]|jgi:NADH-quinone oxidoreductase subunit I|nr:NADH-quinone oxidoreductase subunit I [Bacteroidaceae bacterium]MBQ8243147.1 NADH-quinone oxidoreductase subunit I [Bacteroidaceae bacterium]